MNKEKIKKIAGIVVVAIAVVGYFFIFYPAIVSVNSDGQAECQSIIGLKVGC